MIRAGIFDNQTIGVDELRAMVGTIVPRAGIIDSWYNGEPYNLAVLNQIVRDTVTSGIVPETEGQLKVSYGSGRAIINTGKAIFPNGVIAEITEKETIAVDISYSSKRIALVLNDGEQTVKVVCIGEIPDNTETIFYIPLAAINLDGTVTDLRKYAELIGTTQKGTLCYEIEFDCVAEGLTGNSDLRYSGSGTKKLPISGAYYNFIMVQGSKCLSLVTNVTGAGAEYDSYTSQTDMTTRTNEKAYIYITSNSEMTAKFRRDNDGVYMDYIGLDLSRKFKFIIYASVYNADVIIGEEL